MVHPFFKRLMVFSHYEVETPFCSVLVAVLNHLGNFIGGVDMHEWNWTVTEKRLASEPHQNR